jgi:hypothetical protein
MGRDSLFSLSAGPLDADPFSTVVAAVEIKRI